MTSMLTCQIGGTVADIRRANLADLPDVLRLRHSLAVSDGEGDLFVDRSWALTEGSRILRDVIQATAENKECCLVAVVGHGVVGFLEGGGKGRSSWRPVRATEVRGIFVHEAFRSEGIGRQLIEEFVRWSREQGAEAIELDMFASNGRAAGFYESIGFRPTFITFELPLGRELDAEAHREPEFSAAHAQRK